MTADTAQATAVASMLRDVAATQITTKAIAAPEARRRRSRLRNTAVFWHKRFPRPSYQRMTPGTENSTPGSMREAAPRRYFSLVKALSTSRFVDGEVVSATAGVMAVVLAFYLIAVEPPSSGQQHFDSLSEFGREGITMLWLASSIGAVWAARRAGIASDPALRMIAVGYGLILAGVVIGVGLRRDFWWFLLLAAPGQLLSMAGFVTWAVWARRHSIFGRPTALLCAVGGLVAILGAEFGLTVLIGGFWFGLVPALREARAAGSARAA